MTKLQLYSIRTEKAIEGSSLFYIADMDINGVLLKFTSRYPDSLINKVTYEGEIYA